MKNSLRRSYVSENTSFEDTKLRSSEKTDWFQRLKREVDFGVSAKE